MAQQKYNSHLQHFTHLSLSLWNCQMQIKQRSSMWSENKTVSGFLNKQFICNSSMECSYTHTVLHFYVCGPFMCINNQCLLLLCITLCYRCNKDLFLQLIKSSFWVATKKILIRLNDLHGGLHKPTTLRDISLYMLYTCQLCIWGIAIYPADNVCSILKQQILKVFICLLQHCTT